MNLPCFLVSKNSRNSRTSSLVCKIFGQKIRSCKFFDKSQVCSVYTFFYADKRLESLRTSRQQREASRRGWGTEEYASPTLPKILEPSWTTATLIALLLSTLTSRQFERLQIGCGRLEPRQNLLAKNTMCLFMKM